MEQLVLRDAGKVYTTSRLIAKKFGREHKNILRAIDDLECSDDFKRLNFAPLEINQLHPSPVIKEMREYRITRDGFSFLVMGFTGREAARFKEEFINAFNLMEANLTCNIADPRKLTRMHILQLAMESEGERMMIEQENARLQIKVDVLDQLITAAALQPCS